MRMPKDVLKTLLSKDYAAHAPQGHRHGEGTPRFTTGHRRGAGSAGAGVDFYGRDLGDTIYLTAADGQGNVISFIQSLFGSFGAGFVAGETGITLHNRGSGFNLHAGSSRTRSARTSGRCTRWCRR